MTTRREVEEVELVSPWYRNWSGNPTDTPRGSDVTERPFKVWSRRDLRR